MRGKALLTGLILAGLLAGAILGQMLHDPQYVYNVTPLDQHAHASALKAFKLVGRDIFMGLLFMVIVPLIVASVITGVTSVGNFARLGSIGIRTLIYYFSTMLIAVVIGLVLVHTIQPGRVGYTEAEKQAAAERFAASGKEAAVEAGPHNLGQALLTVLTNLVPSNPIKAAMKPDTLKLIVFSLLFGIVLTTIGPMGQPVADFFRGVNEVMIRLTMLVLWVAPVGVFSLLAYSVAQIGLGSFAAKIGVYMSTVLAGLGVHGLIVLPLALWGLTRYPPWQFLNDMRQSLLMAFSTASSSATLPVTMQCAQHNAGVSKRASAFVLPLGATINMDGTALYEAVAVAFLAQVYGAELGLVQMILIALTATLAAVGAAGIPEAGLVTMAIVVAAVNSSMGREVIPIEGIGFILGVDRILDMCRTTVNVWGDAVGAKIISRWEPDAEPPAC